MDYLEVHFLINNYLKPSQINKNTQTIPIPRSVGAHDFIVIENN